MDTGGVVKAANLVLHWLSHIQQNMRFISIQYGLVVLRGVWVSGMKT